MFCCTINSKIGQINIENCNFIIIVRVVLLPMATDFQMAKTRLNGRAGIALFPVMDIMMGHVVGCGIYIFPRFKSLHPISFVLLFSSRTKELAFSSIINPQRSRAGSSS